MSLMQIVRAPLAAALLAVAAFAASLPAPALAQASAPVAQAAATASATAPMTAPTAAPMAAPSAAATKEEVANPYGLDALWSQGDFVARGTLLILVLMSIGSWYILVTRLAASLKMSAEARSVRQSFFKAATLSAGVATLGVGSAFRYIAEAGINAREHHEGSLTEHIDRNTWITMSVQRSVDEVQSRLQGGLAILATVGSTAPFVGLFGTVWGIYHALTAIGIAGQASIDKVAGPVGEALIMTAIGLAVAVPAVLGYNALVRRNKVTMDAVRGFAADLHGILLGAKNVR